STVDRSRLDEALGGSAVMSHFLAPSRSNAGCPRWDQWQTLKSILHFGDEMDAEVWRLNGRKGTPGEAWEKREVTGVYEQPSAANEWAGNYMGTKKAGIKERRDIPATPEAAKWDGWHTRLKPAIEPIILARRPLDGTVANNVLAHDVGGLNIDACRVPSGESGTADRFPANVLLDKHAAVEMNNQSDDSSRFFPVFKYQAKAPKRERPVIEREAVYGLRDDLTEDQVDYVLARLREAGVETG